MTLCARGGCTNSTTTKYCSRRCVFVARLGAGWRPQDALTFTARSRGGRRSGLSTAARRSRKRARDVKARLAELLAHRALADLDSEQRAAVTALIAMGYRLGKGDGYQLGYRAKANPRIRRGRLAAQQKGQAA